MAKRTDHNQASIVAALRSVGASVQTLHEVGHGCPDLLVGYKGENLLIEVKNPAQKPSDRRLTVDEKSWHESWRGHVVVVETVKEALAVIGVEIMEAA